MKYTIQRLRVGPMASNSYLVSNLEKQAFLVDAGGDAKKILNEIQKQELNLIMILNTHGHFDHIAANAEVMKATGASLYIHQQDMSALFDLSLNLAGYFASTFESVEKAYPLSHGQKLSFGTDEITVLHTPGHTPGGVCYFLEDHLFTGDTLFAGNVGRCDLIGGDMQQLLHSIATQIMMLPDTTKIWPGHQEGSDLGRERASNPWIQKALALWKI